MDFQNLKDAPKVMMIDPSLEYRPEQVEKESGWDFRKFEDSSEDPKMKQVKQTYLEMHTNQTVEYVTQRVSLKYK